MIIVMTKMNQRVVSGTDKSKKTQVNISDEDDSDDDQKVAVTDDDDDDDYEDIRDVDDKAVDSTLNTHEMRRNQKETLLLNINWERVSGKKRRYLVYNPSKVENIEIG